MNSDTPQCWRDVEAVLGAGVNRVLLYGPPGVGKTYAGLHYGETSRGAWRLVCTEDMTQAEITGCWMPAAEGRWAWHDGTAIKAWNGDGLRGGRLVIDEIDKAAGDVASLLLAVCDSVGSASFEHPGSGLVLRPRDGFSIVATTNVERMEDLPDALGDRFPVRVRINEPHPSALATLPADLRPYARRAADLPGARRTSLRSFQAFATLRSSLAEADAARIVWGEAKAKAILDAIAIDKVAA